MIVDKTKSKTRFGSRSHDRARVSSRGLGLFDSVNLRKHEQRPCQYAWHVIYVGVTSMRCF
jgi:hypothetical protein